MAPISFFEGFAAGCEFRDVDPYSKIVSCEHIDCRNENCSCHQEGCPFMREGTSELLCTKAREDNLMVYGDLLIRFVDGDVQILCRDSQKVMSVNQTRNTVSVSTYQAI